MDRKKILHYHQLYINRPDPITFLPVAVDTTDRIYDDLESDQFRFLIVVAMIISRGQWD